MRHKYAFVFPGQGSQKLGKLDLLYNQYSCVQEKFNQASDILGYNVYKFLVNSGQDELSKIELSSPIILTIGVSFYDLAKKIYGIEPAVLAGHSLGEYTALTCAGFLSFEDTLKLVVYRAKLARKICMQTHGVMGIVFHPIKDVERICKKMRAANNNIWISCYNSPTQACVVGEERVVNEFKKMVSNIGIKVKIMKNNAPFHSGMMKDCMTDLGTYIEGIQINKPNKTVLSDVYAKPYTLSNFKSNLVSQFIYPVQWMEVINKCQKLNIDTFLEMSSVSILSRLINETDSSLNTIGLYQPDQINKLLQ